MIITDLFQYAEKNNCSDIHISTGYSPIFRLHGEMRPIDSVEPLTAEKIYEMLHSIMNDNQKKLYEEEHEIDYSTQTEGSSRFRVNAFHTINGPAAVFRIIPTEILSLERLKAPSVFKKFTMLEKGLVLVTGPTGSGKSTTLAAMINHINENHKKHILTIEDPVEFVHKSKMSLINQREVGANTNSFARALKSALREDPDVILVGEMRDLETIQLAITAAETGHLVFGTLHTSSAPQTVDRIIDVFPSGDKPMIRAMLSNSLEGVITQKLLKRQDIAGRIAAHEIMICTTSVRNLIREAKTPQLFSMIQIGRKIGMQLMKEVVEGYFEKGIISEEEMKGALNLQSKEEQKDDPELGSSNLPDQASSQKPNDQQDNSDF